jgi:UDP-glucose 4-epimerase
MRILFTGASSFTGFWFARALAAAGHELICPLRGDPDSYTGTRKERVRRLAASMRLVPRTLFGTAEFCKLIRDCGPWDLMCHHAAEVTNYRHPAFDELAALRNNTNEAARTLRELREQGARALVSTGTVFEPDEGVGDEPRYAFSPYGLSKALTWQVLRYRACEAGLAIGKFVISNPFGPLEEPRFTGYLMKQWEAGQVAEVKTPDYVRDNIAVDALAAAYAGFAARVAEAAQPEYRFNPSGYVERQGQFAQRVAAEVARRTGWRCDLNLAKQTDFSEPLRRVNTEPARAFVPDWNEAGFWDGFVTYYRRPLGYDESG